MTNFKNTIVFSILVSFTPLCFSATLAIVGSKKISTQEFNKRYNDILKQTITPPTKKQFLEELIRYEMGIQEAKKKKLQNHPIIKERMDQEVYKLLLEKEIGKRVESIKVSEPEMRAYYKKNPEIRSSHILIQFGQNPTKRQKAEALKRATKILAEVKKSSGSFTKKVKIYSDDTFTKQNGGDAGWQNGLTLVPSYYEPIKNAPIKSIVGPLETAFGFHIVKVTGRRSFDQANKDNIKAAVFDRKRKKIFDQYFVNLKSKYKISLPKNF